MNPSLPQTQAAEGFKSVGRITQAQGLTGEVFVRLFAGVADWLPHLEAAETVRFSGQDFTFESCWEHKGGVVIKCSAADDRTQAETLRGLELQIPVEFLRSGAGEPIYLDELLGFEVIDATVGLVGIIENFSSNGAQDLLVVSPRDASEEKKSNKKEILIPFIKPFVEKMDFEKRVIKMNLPAGLIDLP